MDATVASSVNKSDVEDEEFAPRRAISNYKNLLDSDSEDDDNRNISKEVSEPDQAKSDEDEENVTRKSSSSSDSESEKAAPVKDRRKNRNPKKKILPVKTIRVSALLIYVQSNIY